MNTFTVSTWNIGHFSMGGRRNSNITDAEYADKVIEYRNYVNDRLDADIISLNEYSKKFTETRLTKEELFGRYPTFIEGEQRNYSCNALYSKLPLEDIRTNEFECNKTAEITHTTLITAADYYYITAKLAVDGKEVQIVSAHLAFDKNRDPDTVNTDQIKELIAVMSKYDRVLMVGDWNCLSFSYFKLFEDAGYTLANADEKLYTCGDYSIDNVIYRGVEVSDFKVMHTDLSDHHAVACKVAF